MNPSLVLILAASVALAACSKSEPDPAPSAAPAQPATVAAGALVTQVIQTGMYTYAEVEVRPGLKGWLAGTQLDIKEGDRIEWGQAAPMRNFHAASIGRTFDEILFVGAWGKAGTAPVQAAPHGVLPPPPATPAAGGGGGGSGVVKSVAHSGGYSYVEVQSGADTLWVAAPETPLKVGDNFAWQGGSEMSNFNARSLGRVFDRIIFASSGSATR